ncbi:MAG: molybdopterin-dependent oxidoreductase [Nitrospinaceae bacterium]
MRAVDEMITRRKFLRHGLSGWAIFWAAWLKNPFPGWAETDYFSGTDFVGKTRAGEYRHFYINFWKPMRRIRPGHWHLEVTGLCENPRRFTLDEIKSLPVKKRSSRLKCVECWSARAEWRGCRVTDLESLVRPLPEARGVVFHCADAFREYLSRECLHREETLLAYAMDGEPLPDEHGYPLRVIIPFKYGYKNPKSILKMEYVSGTQPGTWSKIGPYSIDGTILPGYDHPLDLGQSTRRIPGGEITEY